jgi:site-specific recombinase XerD
MKGCRPLTRIEVKQVLKTGNSPRENALLTLGFSTGYRISELLSLKISDVATATGEIFHSVYVRKTKNGEGRSVPLNTDSRKSLKRLVAKLFEAGHDTNAPLFSGRKNKGRRAISRQHAWRLIKKLFELAKVVGGKLATHSLRKTFALRMKEALKGDLQQIQAALGHKSIASTIAYLSFDIGNVNRAIQELAL